jgi:uncharacterized protein (UPF0335 family)
MAEAATPNHVSKDQIEAFLDRYEGLEDEAVEIMTTAMAACKNGPRAGQKDLRAEMKSGGVRMKTFNALWMLRQEIRKSERKVAELEDDDLDQMREFAQAMKGTPFGDLIQMRLDEPAF